MNDIQNIDYQQLQTLLKRYSRFIGEVRRRILTTLIVFAFACVLGFVFYEQIIIFLIEILNLKGINLVFTSPFQFINLAIGCGIATGLTLSFPLIIIQLLYFLKPALKVKEFRTILRALPFSIVLFATGFIFGALVMKWQIDLFLAKSVSLGIGNVLDITSLLNTVLMVSVIMGISFQFPIILLVLLRIGVLARKTLSQSRKWVYLGVFLFSILLPMDSILADLLLCLPLLLIFEATLLIDRLFELNSKRSKN